MACSVSIGWVFTSDILVNSVKFQILKTFLEITSVYCICSETSVFSPVPGTTAAAVVGGLFTATTVATDCIVTTTASTADLVVAAAFVICLLAVTAALLVANVLIFY